MLKSNGKNRNNKNEKKEYTVYLYHRSDRTKRKKNKVLTLCIKVYNNKKKGQIKVFSTFNKM